MHIEQLIAAFLSKALPNDWPLKEVGKLVDVYGKLKQNSFSYYVI